MADRVFHRLIVDHLVRGGTRVAWVLDPLFADPDPWIFTLQVGATGNPAADDWADVGVPAPGAAVLVDDVPRLGGTNPVTHYRVVLQTPLGRYTSRPHGIAGVLAPHDWLVAREIVRKERLRGDLLVAVPGQLLKRRRTGAPADPSGPADPRTAVVDPLTGGIIARREGSWGTPFEHGYYKPVPYPIDLKPGALDEEVDPAGTGTADPAARLVAGRAVLFPPLAAFDLWIADGSDRRFVIHSVKVAAQYRGVPLVGDPVELRLLPYTDLLYQLDPAAL